MVEIFSGLIGGLGVVLIWEGLLKPRRDRTRIARLLATEISQNMQLMAGQLSAAGPKPKAIPADFYLSTFTYNALGSQVGELPAKALGKVLLLFGRFEYLNRTAAFFWNELDAYGRTPEAEPAKRIKIQRNLDTALEAFYRLLSSTIDHGNETLNSLRGVAEPWWRRRKPLPAVPMEEVDRRVRVLLAERDRRLQ